MRPPHLPALVAYARECLAADQFPEAHHPFTVKGCPAACGLVPLELTVQHHRGSEERDFLGGVSGRCSRCSAEGTVLAILTDDPTPLREEHPECVCGSHAYYVAEMERIEGAEGLEGFFDEGILVGQCAQCGRHRALVYTD